MKPFSGAVEIRRKQPVTMFGVGAGNDVSKNCGDAFEVRHA
jgi:hypothetical protein